MMKRKTPGKFLISSKGRKRDHQCCQSEMETAATASQLSAQAIPEADDRDADVESRGMGQCGEDIVLSPPGVSECLIKSARTAKA